MSLLSLLPSFASAATRTWDGADLGSGAWSSPANWGGTAPSATGDSLVFGGSNHLTDNSNDLSLSVGSLTFATGAGAFVLSGNSITINNAAAVTNSLTSLQTINNNIVLGATSGTQTIDGKNGIVVNGAISSTNAITLGISGVVTLAGNNTHTGGTTLSSGNTLNLSNAGALGTGTFSINGGVFNNTSGGALTLNNNAQIWSGTLNFTGTNSLNFGTGAVSTGTGGTRSIVVSASTLTVGGIIADGTAATSLSKSGSGDLVLSGANNFSGGFTLGGAGVVYLGHKSALGTGSVTLNHSSGSIAAGTNLSGANSVANNLIFSAGTNTISGANNLTLTGNVTSTATANRNFVYSGAGVLTLAGANSYNGSTTVNGGGALLVDGSHTGGTAYSISSGRLGGGGSITLTNLGITIASGAKLAPGNSSQTDGTFSINLGTGTLNLSAAVGGANTGALLFDLGAVGAPNTDLLTLTGTLNIGTGVLEFADFSFTTLSGFNAGTYILMDASTISGSLGSSLTGTISGYSGTISRDSLNNNIVLTVVPEPSSAAAFLAGTVLVFGTRRRRSLLSQ